MENTRYNKSKFSIDGFTLKMIAMVAMLMDHSRILFPNASWLNYIGRLALPIFCYLIVEGFYHTHSIRKYATRLLCFAIVSQIPYMLCVYKSLSWNGLNVLFTLLIGLLVIAIIDCYKFNKAIYMVSIIVVTMGGQYLAKTFNSDGCYVAVYMMVCFYVFRNKHLLQFLSMVIINGHLTLSLNLTTIAIGQIAIPIQRQLLAVFALIPIWLYNGRKGISNRYIQYGFYAFYPIHLMLLWIVFQIQLL